MTYAGEVSRQQARFISEINEMNDIYFKSHGRRKKAFCGTYGCQQNVADTEKISGMLCQMEFEITDEPDDADIIIINTCAVREHAEQRVFGNIGEYSHLKKNNPNLIIAVCGCMAQQQHIADKLKKSFPCVDIVFGTHALPEFPEMLYGRLNGGKRVFNLSDNFGKQIIEGMPTRRGEGIKAWLSIMYGCDNFCSYCIVPYVRGRERSRGFDDIYNEFVSLVANGYKDITLLGQNVNSYGKGTGQNIDFPELLDRLASLDGDFIIRFMTSHPKDASEKLFKVMAKHDKITKHLHLPFQSGSDRILKQMNRKYNSAEYLNLIETARGMMPTLSITSDVIVGFPGETDEDFEKTMELIEKVKFSSLFTFIYSKRQGTPAAKMPDPTTDAQKHQRFDRLVARQNDISLLYNKALVGETLDVLVDGTSRDTEYTLSARTHGGRLVYVKGEDSIIGSFARVKIIKCSSFALFGELCRRE